MHETKFIINKPSAFHFSLYSSISVSSNYFLITVTANTQAHLKSSCNYIHHYQLLAFHRLYFYINVWSYLLGITVP